MLTSIVIYMQPNGRAFVHGNIMFVNLYLPTLGFFDVQTMSMPIWFDHCVRACYLLQLDWRCIDMTKSLIPCLVGLLSLAFCVFRSPKNQQYFQRYADNSLQGEIPKGVSRGGSKHPAPGYMVLVAANKQGGVGSKNTAQ